MDKWKSTRSVVNLRQGRNDWYRIENNAGTAEVYIYDEIGYFGITAADFVKEIGNLRTDTIELHLNSPGGEVFDAIAIYNALNNHKAEVTVTVDGIAASAASFIAMAGDKVVMTKNATMMIHDAHGLAIGNAKDMRELADLLDKTSDNIASIYAERAGGTVASWRKAMGNETWYSADEAVKAGLADEVKGTSKSDNSWDLSIFNYAGRSQAPTPEIAPALVATFDAELFRKALQEVYS